MTRPAVESGLRTVPPPARLLLIEGPAVSRWSFIRDVAALPAPVRVTPEQALVTTHDPLVGELEDDSFDAVVCPLGLSSFADTTSVLAAWLRVLLPGGTVASSAVGTRALRPWLDVYCQQLLDFGLAAASQLWNPYPDAEVINWLMRDAGFTEVRVVIEEHGRQLHDFAAWWELIGTSSLATPLSELTSEQRTAFQTEHLERIGRLAKADGLWLPLPLITVNASKPD